MSKVITVDLSRSSEGKKSIHGIVFEEGHKIIDIVSVPADYTVEDFMEILKNKPYYELDIPVLFDENGIGILLEGYFPNSQKCAKNREDMAEYLETGKQALFDIALNSNFDTFQKMEFKKLSQELNNLSVMASGNGKLNLNVLDKNKSVNRALAYLLYFTTDQGRSEYELV